MNIILILICVVCFLIGAGIGYLIRLLREPDVYDSARKLLQYEGESNGD